MNRLYVLIILLNCIGYSQFTNATISDYPSNATTDSIQTAITKMLHAISSNDSIEAAKSVIREGRVMRVFNKDGNVNISFRSNNTWIEQTGKRKINVHERMWSPIIFYRGDMAIAWTSYDFHIKNKFSHCGAEMFNLVRVNNHWLVSDWAYTVEPNNCEVSTLGPYVNKSK